MFKRLFGPKTAEQEPPRITVPEDEIIAVISAAVYSFYEGSGITPKIRGVRPAAVTRPVWAAAGILENTRPFLP